MYFVISSNCKVGKVIENYLATEENPVKWSDIEQYIREYNFECTSYFSASDQGVITRDLEWYGIPVDVKDFQLAHGGVHGLLVRACQDSANGFVTLQELATFNHPTLITHRVEVLLSYDTTHIVASIQLIPKDNHDDDSSFDTMSELEFFK